MPAAIASQPAESSALWKLLQPWFQCKVITAAPSGLRFSEGTRCSEKGDMNCLFFADETQPLSVVIASGQFTLPEDLGFEPLKELIQFCAQHKPNLLLLLGPFVDVDHPLIQGGVVDEAFDDIFDSLVCTTFQVEVACHCNLGLEPEMMHWDLRRSPQDCHKLPK